MDFVSNVVSFGSKAFSGTIVKQVKAVVFGVDSRSDTATGEAKQQSSEAKTVNNQPDTQTTQDAIQQLFSNSPLTSSGSHDFRNRRHAEFLEHNPFAVRLKSYVATDTLIAFRTTPEIIESRHIAYKTIDPLHMPGSIQVFQNSSPRTWNISGLKLVSRNGVEAEENLAIVNQLRAWQVPFFGQSTTTGREDYQVEMLGAPPEVLEFSAYSNATEQGVTNIRQIPVLITSFSAPYSSDVDYIQTAHSNQPFPSVMLIDIVLIETHSPREFNVFDLIKYKNGNLPGF